MKKSIATAAVIALVAGCGGAQTFGLTSDDNNQAALGRALAVRQLPDKATPENATGKPMLFAVLAGKQRKMVAYDLTTGKPTWTVDADVQSRVEVGDDFVVAREGSQIVARNLGDGAVRWKHGVTGEVMGLAADGERAYVTVANTAGDKPVWTLTALDADSGSPAWSADSPGQLGGPAAQGGLVMSPFLKQWLSILDARTGQPLTRIRGIDEEIGFVRTTSDAAWFGSSQGVFRLDGAAASGQRAQSSYGTAKLPKQLARADWGRDGFDAVQAGYTAADRTRILWRAAPAGEGPLVFQDGLIAVHYFRYLFGYSVDGELKWAYSQPRVELVGSAHAGSVLVAISQQGDVIALDPGTGKMRWQGELGAEGRVLGATFDADGWAPEGDIAVGASGTVGALIAIARDRDARFADVKELAVSALANLPGKEVSAELLGMIQDARTPPKLRETAVEVLVSRRDASALDVYAKALSVRADYISNTRPVAVAEVARVVAGLAGPDLEKADAEARKAAVDGLVLQLEAPESTNVELFEIVRALAAIGGGAELPALRRQLLAYRADPQFGGDPKLVKVVIDALLAGGGAEDRETVAFVAEDPRTYEAVASYADKALSGN